MTLSYVRKREGIDEYVCLSLSIWDSAGLSPGASVVVFIYLFLFVVDV